MICACECVYIHIHLCVFVEYFRSYLCTHPISTYESDAIPKPAIVIKGTKASEKGKGGGDGTKKKKKKKA